ncbi:hypothetical protein A2U10_09975 [Fusobacterium necrophorum subsp. funduliforme]|uniref:PF14387 domain protein n=2 Tax=Fusobacterium necrophorum TaxID=859 RepID=A0AAN3VUJ4_9FUSO|nr:DUF4418 family protein [Fusobacterium necrophorum]AYV95124.1 DUF4418 family protein [Fusobacterium necrophorum subsp. funduliforme]EFS24165.1 hypothetical protein FSEG_01772 [Fusobacterium necrophorum D12]EJU15724.1 PF14387 domain protein [Fusobacterium necrophorum subsp. funduliforme Fnf 1007]KYL01463.1 hypothetical protein A2J05_02915 [Fusobacterium necrophorum subsp. funduliforme]KYL03214.1 hypothetical protein A2J06_02265 [Fusobacterium necrophorum subsp. funduliforme]
MKKNIFEKLGILLSILLLLIPKWIAPICPGMKEDGTHMGCFYSGNLVMKIAVMIMILCILMIVLSKYKYLRLLGSALVIVLSAFSYLIPHGMTHMHNEMGKPYGFCKMESMACRANHTFEIVGIVAGLIALVMIINIITILLKKEK